MLQESKGEITTNVWNQNGGMMMRVQIILGKSHTVTRKSLEGWAPLKACNAHLWIGQNARINTPVFQQIFAKILRSRLTIPC